MRQPGDLTVGWAQKIVNQHAPGTEVSKLEIISTDIGTTTRVRVAIKHNGPTSLPKRWFVKLPSLAWRARLVTALPREVRFYKDTAQSVPIKRPVTLAAQGKFGQGATLVLTDVTEHGAIPGNSSESLTAAQATVVIKQLAVFHAHFWNITTRNPEYRWLAGPVRRLEDGLGTALAVPLMERGIKLVKLAGSLVPKAIHAFAIRYAKRRNRAMRFLTEGP